MFNFVAKVPFAILFLCFFSFNIPTYSTIFLKIIILDILECHNYILHSHISKSPISIVTCHIVPYLSLSMGVCEGFGGVGQLMKQNQI